MPIAEYECKQKHITEKIFLKASDVTQTTKCAECKRKATKILSAPSLFPGADSWRKIIK